MTSTIRIRSDERKSIKNPEAAQALFDNVLKNGGWFHVTVSDSLTDHYFQGGSQLNFHSTGTGSDPFMWGRNSVLEFVQFADYMDWGICIFAVTQDEHRSGIYFDAMSHEERFARLVGIRWFDGSEGCVVPWLEDFQERFPQRPTAVRPLPV